MDSDLLIRIGAHPIVHGVKHTDHDVGRMARMIKAKKQIGMLSVRVQNLVSAHVTQSLDELS